VVELPWAADSCPWVAKLRTVMTINCWHGADPPFILAAFAECKLAELMQPSFCLELRGPRGKGSAGVLRPWAPPAVKRIRRFPMILRSGVKLRPLWAVDFSAGSFAEPQVRRLDPERRRGEGLSLWPPLHAQVYWLI
jgi:hypothetical protein